MWRLRFGEALDAWAVVPAPDELERRASWGPVVADAVRSQWTTDEVERWSAALDEVVETLQRTRPAGTLADLVTWPMRSPLPLRVTFVAATDAATTDWEAHGYESTPYLHGPFGEGVQHTRRTPPDLSSGAESVDAVIVFDRGDLSLVVRVHPCPVVMYVASAAMVADLVDASELTDASGAPFTTGVRAHRVLGDADLWQMEAGDARG